MLKTPSPSIFRPKGGVDQSVLREHKALVEDINRRKILRGALSIVRNRHHLARKFAFRSIREGRRD